ncbi:MAG: hypothetical protein R3F58_01265 [Steroidobacteraceae bacterium]
MAFMGKFLEIVWGGIALARGITARAAVKDRRPPQAANAPWHSSLTASTA